VAELKTKQTAADVASFLGAIEHPGKRADALAVAALMEAVSGEPARMWGSSIVGFGRYDYRYESGHSGTAMRVGFSPRKQKLVLYIMGGFPRHAELMERLGKYKTGKSCLYLNKLADVDQDVLRELVAASWAYMAETYPPGV
jgi:hypothetical protein